MLSEKAKGKQRALDPSEDLEEPWSRPLVIRFTEGIPDLTVTVEQEDTNPRFDDGLEIRALILSCPQVSLPKSTDNGSVCETHPHPVTVVDKVVVNVVVRLEEHR